MLKFTTYLGAGRTAHTSDNFDEMFNIIETNTPDATEKEVHVIVDPDYDIVTNGMPTLSIQGKDLRRYNISFAGDSNFEKNDPSTFLPTVFSNCKLGTTILAGLGVKNSYFTNYYTEEPYGSESCSFLNTHGLSGAFSGCFFMDDTSSFAAQASKFVGCKKSDGVGGYVAYEPAKLTTGNYPVV